MAGYIFRRAGAVDRQREYMQRCLDPISIGRFQDLGVGPGWRCLDVGGGGGSVARWLSECVGETGHVLVTDLDPGAIRPAGNLTVRRHDITSGPPPESGFDLVHARLVLFHLPDRLRALDHMVRALRPGGALMLGEFDCTWMPVLSASDVDAELFSRFHRALCALLAGAGADIAWGSHAYQALRDQGLTGLGHVAQAQAWRGGDPGCRWLQVNLAQLHDRLLTAGPFAPTELDALHNLLDDPDFVVTSYLTTITWGYRPIET